MMKILMLIVLLGILLLAYWYYDKIFCRGDTEPNSANYIHPRAQNVEQDSDSDSESKSKKTKPKSRPRSRPKSRSKSETESDSKPGFDSDFGSESSDQNISEIFGEFEESDNLSQLSDDKTAE